MNSLRHRLYLLMLMLLFLNDLRAQCTMCKAVAEDEVEDEGATGINAGILYIMIIPYIILMIVFRKRIVSFFRELRKATGNSKT